MDSAPPHRASQWLKPGDGDPRRWRRAPHGRGSPPADGAHTSPGWSERTRVAEGRAAPCPARLDLHPSRPLSSLSSSRPLTACTIKAARRALAWLASPASRRWWSGVGSGSPGCQSRTRPRGSCPQRAGQPPAASAWSCRCAGWPRWAQTRSARTSPRGLRAPASSGRPRAPRQRRRRRAAPGTPPAPARPRPALRPAEGRRGPPGGIERRSRGARRPRRRRRAPSPANSRAPRPAGAACSPPRKHTRGRSRRHTTGRRPGRPARAATPRRPTRHCPAAPASR
mmetsp:Transcript_5696/g.18079  ORF Transcript_5696/g.18079 Transcript_5696/m.18079 type:complete len:283 (+) Transcript_5696:1461-2309(+)